MLLVNPTDVQAYAILRARFAEELASRLEHQISTTCLDLAPLAAREIKRLRVYMTAPQRDVRIDENLWSEFCWSAWNRVEFAYVLIQPEWLELAAQLLQRSRTIDFVKSFRAARDGLLPRPKAGRLLQGPQT